MKKRECRDYLHDILDAVDNAESFVEGMSFEQFAKDKKTLNAVVRSLEIIGEAAKNIGKTEAAKRTGAGEVVMIPCQYCSGYCVNGNTA